MTFTRTKNIKGFVLLGERSSGKQRWSKYVTEMQLEEIPQLCNVLYISCTRSSSRTFFWTVIYFWNTSFYTNSCFVFMFTFTYLYFVTWNVNAKCQIELTLRKELQMRVEKYWLHFIFQSTRCLNIFQS